MYKFCRTAQHLPPRLRKPCSRGFQTVNKFLVLKARVEGISHFPVFKLLRVWEERGPASTG